MEEEKPVTPAAAFHRQCKKMVLSKLVPLALLLEVFYWFCRPDELSFYKGFTL